MAILITIVSYLIRIYSFLILIRVLLSWVNTNPYGGIGQHPLVRLLMRVTEPVLAPLRRIIPPIGGVVDVSPAVALILLEVTRLLLIAVLSRL